MRDRVGLIEPDEALRGQVLSTLDRAGLCVQPYEGLAEYLLFRGRGDYAVLVGDTQVDALGVRESLYRQGEWLAVIGYAANPGLRRVTAFMRAGGYDFFDLPLDGDGVAHSIEQLHRGDTRYAAVRRRAAAARLKLDTLSAREAEVLAKMAEGQSNKAIGIDLGISPRTVEIHRAHMLSKLGADSSTEALRMYYQDELLAGKAMLPTR